MDFDSESQALGYAMYSQMARRNMTTAALAKAEAKVKVKAKTAGPSPGFLFSDL
jgi:hypothetical protein